MNKNKSAVLVLVLVLAISAEGLGQAKIGTTVAQFLGISVGPKAISMGGAYVAAPGDVSSLYWNPGAISRVAGTQLTFSTTDWLVGTKFRWVGAVFNFDGTNAVGLSLTQLDYGEEEVTTVALPNGTGERWSAQDMALTLSYARNFTDRFSLGGTVKYVSQSIANESANTVAFDFGLMFITGFNDMRLGMSIANFGGSMSMDGRDLLQQVDIAPDVSGNNDKIVSRLKVDEWPIPLYFRVGAAMDVLKGDPVMLTVAADAVRPTDNVEYVNVGAQLGWSNLLFFRAGYRSLGMDDTQEGLTLGAGVRYGLEGLGAVEVNYAYNEFGLFGNLNTLSFSVAF